MLIVINNHLNSTILQIGDIDVNVRDADGWTPLHAAIHWGSQTATELLTDAGADFDLKNNNVRFAIFMKKLLNLDFYFQLGTDLLTLFDLGSNTLRSF